jgi:hypothetical protein
MELNLPCLQESDEIRDLSNCLESGSNISEKSLERLAFSYLRPDAGKQEIKLISRILAAIESQDSTFFPRYLVTFLTTVQEPVFALHFLCVFSNIIFKDYKKEVTSKQFWNLVQASLTHECSLTRKRGLYLAKRFTDEIQSFQFKDSAVIHLFADDALLKNNKLWEDYFLILECLEEKQVHIIQQVLNRLQVLQAFDSSWTAIVFKRFFAHQNIIVVRWGLDKFFEFVDVKAAGAKNAGGDFIGVDECLLDLIVQDLLQTLNMSKLYSKENGHHTGQTLATQLSSCINTLIKCDYFFDWKL